MSDSIEVPGAGYVPIQDTICECGHWYEEHGDSTDTVTYSRGIGSGAVHVRVSCMAPECTCVCFVADPAQSTPEAIVDRGGDPELLPEHVKRAFGDV